MHPCVCACECRNVNVFVYIFMFMCGYMYVCSFVFVKVLRLWIISFRQWNSEDWHLIVSVIIGLRKVICKCVTVEI